MRTVLLPFTAIAALLFGGVCADAHAGAARPRTIKVEAKAGGGKAKARSRLRAKPKAKPAQRDTEPYEVVMTVKPR